MTYQFYFCQRDLYVSDYSKLYGETIYPIIANIDGWKSNSSRGITLYRPWVDSSPSNGLISPKNNIYEADGMSDDTRHSNAHMNIWYQQISTIPYAKLWGSASTTTAGDMHYYNYDADCEDISSIPEPRFISEFGSQSHPSFLTYRPVLNDADMHPNSEVIRFRQRHENGDAQMEKQVM
jgi:beta-mannosidase